MTLNDLLRKVQALAMQSSSGDIELITDDWDGIDIDFEIAQDSFDGKYYVKVIETIHYEQM